MGLLDNVPFDLKIVLEGTDEYLSKAVPATTVAICASGELHQYGYSSMEPGKVVLVFLNTENHEKAKQQHLESCRNSLGSFLDKVS